MAPDPEHNGLRDAHGRLATPPPAFLGFVRRLLRSRLWPVGLDDPSAVHPGCKAEASADGFPLKLAAVREGDGLRIDLAGPPAGRVVGLMLATVSGTGAGPFTCDKADPVLACVARPGEGGSVILRLSAADLRAADAAPPGTRWLLQLGS